MSDEQRLIDAGRAALAEMERLFQLDVIDPAARDLAPPAPGSSPKLHLAHERAVHSREVIDEILKACGWGWRTPYAGNHLGPEWCGLAAGKGWAAAGLDPTWLAAFFPSTLRLHYWAHYRDWNDHGNRPPASGPRRVAIQVDGKLPDGFTPREGDIVIVGDGNPGVGDHITVFKREVAPGRWLTISGNGGGNGPDGKYREGIVEREFSLSGTGYRVLWIYRPALSDLL